MASMRSHNYDDNDCEKELKNPECQEDFRAPWDIPRYRHVLSGKGECGERVKFFKRNKEG